MRMNNKQLYERQVPSSNLFFLARDNASVKKKSEGMMALFCFPFCLSNYPSTQSTKED